MILTPASRWLISNVVGCLMVSVVPPAIAPTAAVSAPTQSPSPASVTIAAVPTAIRPAIAVGQPLYGLQQRLQSLQSAQFVGLNPGIAVLDLQTGNYASINGDQVYPTASIIKVPILIALFQDIDAGKIQPQERLTMTRDLMVGGSGDLQYQRPDRQFSVLETATKMITISDNTATNMIIRRMGGMQALNQRFRQWGLRQTQIRDVLPDRWGKNVTTPTELVQLLAMLDNQQLLSASSRAQVLAIMSQVRNRTLLPAGLGEGAAIAHKTGDIGFLQGDMGIVRTPNGQRYIVAMLVKRDRAEASSRAFIQQASRLVYAAFTQPTTTAQAR